MEHEKPVSGGSWTFCPNSGNHWPSTFGPETFYASVYSSVNRECLYSFYPWAFSNYVKQFLAVQGLANRYHYYLLVKDADYMSFIKLFHINIVVLNRSIHIYRIYISRNLVCPTGHLLQTRERLVMLMVLADTCTSSSPLPDLVFPTYKKRAVLPNVLGRGPWLIRLRAQDWRHASFIL